MHHLCLRKDTHECYCRWMSCSFRWPVRGWGILPVGSPHLTQLDIQKPTAPGVRPAGSNRHRANRGLRFHYDICLAMRSSICCCIPIRGVLERASVLMEASQGSPWGVTLCFKDPQLEADFALDHAARHRREDAIGSFILTAALYVMIVLTKTGMVRAGSDVPGFGILSSLSTSRNSHLPSTASLHHTIPRRTNHGPCRWMSCDR